MAPDSAEVKINLGLVHIYQDNFEKAKELFEDALQNDPDSVEAHNNLGIVQFYQGRLEDAISSFKMAEELEEAHTNLNLVCTENDENLSNVHLSPVGAPMGVPAVWCETVA